MAGVRSRKLKRKETEPDHPARMTSRVVMASLAMIIIAPFFVYVVAGRIVYP